MTDRNAPSVLLGIDVGSKRIGLALAHSDVRISHPFTTVIHDQTVMTTLHDVIKREAVTMLVVGLPRGMAGQSTAQTAVAQTFAEELARRTGLPVHLQDEALTSVKAEAELNRRGRPFDKGEVDSLAATYILQDYLETVHV